MMSRSLPASWGDAQISGLPKSILAWAATPGSMVGGAATFVEVRLRSGRAWQGMDA